jgi:hypothetical protein
VESLSDKELLGGFFDAAFSTGYRVFAKFRHGMENERSYFMEFGQSVKNNLSESFAAGE